jgi:hypothetical protein
MCLPGPVTPTVGKTSVWVAEILYRTLGIIAERNGLTNLITES